MQYHQPYSGRGGRHPTYHSNRHRSRPATSYNTTSYPNYYRQYIPSNQGINPPPSKRRRAEPSTWHPDSLPRQIGDGSSGGGTSRPREEEPGFMSKDEIDRCSPSRKDGIDSLMEARLRQSYCSYLKNLGLRLALPQSTIATAIVMCHRFYLRRSHACHDRFLVATAALFLASKSEESPCLLNTVLRVSFEVSQSPEFAFVPYMIHGQNWFDQYRERVIEVEQLILTTLDFELEVKHPYGPLNSGLNKLGFSRTVLYNLAWNLVTEGLRSSLWLQFKPHHIAAGAAYLAAKLLHYDITLYPSFWQDFQTTPYIVQDVVQQLMELL
ncbi:cyclin-T1-4-like isoform X1 [Carex rostrata]